MNEAQTEAIAQADAHASNSGLPTYSELAAMIRRADEVLAVWAPHATCRYDIGLALDKLGRLSSVGDAGFEIGTPVTFTIPGARLVGMTISGKVREGRRLGYYVQAGDRKFFVLQRYLSKHVA